MGEFLSIDLDYEEQPATIRLNDTITTILQAYFNVDGAIITRFGVSGKHEQFRMATREIQELCAAWTEYQARLAQHTIDIAERKQATVAEAKALAKSVQFDLPELNVHAKHEGNTWKITIPAIGYERYANINELLQTVQEALDKIKRDVEQAEKSGWCGDWNEIIASYRRVFALELCQLCQKSFDRRDLKKLGTGCDLLVVCDPCGQKELARREAEQGEQLEKAARELSEALKEVNASYVDPETIIEEARELLKQSLHPADWTLCAVYPGTTNDCWSFDNGLDGEKHYAIFNKPAKELYQLIDRYLIENNIARSASEQDALTSDI